MYLLTGSIQKLLNFFTIFQISGGVQDAPETGHLNDKANKIIFLVVFSSFTSNGEQRVGVIIIGSTFSICRP